MMRLRTIALCLVPFAFCLGVDAAQNEGRAGANPAITLRLSPSARAAAMGDAYAGAVTGTEEALYYNPAGLGWPGQRRISGMYQKLVLDVGQGTLGYVHPISEHSAWGVLAQYVDFGSTERTVVNAAGTAGQRSGTFTGHDIAVSASYGALMTEFWSYGITAKVYSSQIDNVKATAFAADLGLKWKTKEWPLSLGVSVKNLGTNIKYDFKQERMPIVFRGGIAWEPWDGRLRLTTDVEKIAREGWALHSGAEYTFAKMFSVRIGYDGSLEIDNGLTLGGGFRHSGLALDYAYIPFGKVGSNHRMGLSYEF